MATKSTNPGPIAAAAKTGNRLEILKACRDKVAVAIDQSGGGRDVAGLTCQMRALLVEIEGLELAGKPSAGSVADEIRSGHAAR